jgi:hypothetical protein
VVALSGEHRRIRREAEEDTPDRPIMRLAPSTAEDNRPARRRRVENPVWGGDSWVIDVVNSQIFETSAHNSRKRERVQLRDAVIAYPTMAERLGQLVSNLPAR